MSYLELNKTKKPQYFSGRRDEPTGCQVIHTAESGTDTVGIDTRPQAVASNMLRQNRQASYHTISGRGAGNRIRLVSFENEAFHVGTRTSDNVRYNSLTIGISSAMNSADWETLSGSLAGEYIDGLVHSALEANYWLVFNDYRSTAPVILTRAEVDLGLPGFISHARLDPSRRSDPGPFFPWSIFIKRYEEKYNRVEQKEAAMLLRESLAELEIVHEAVFDRPPSEERRRGWMRWLIDILSESGEIDIISLILWVNSELKKEKANNA